MPFLPEKLIDEKLEGIQRFRTPEGYFGRKRVVGPLAAKELLRNIGSQRDALLERLTVEGIETLDLTPRFQEAAARGEQLYRVLDTHWTSAGHALAASAIAERLRARRGN